MRIWIRNPLAVWTGGEGDAAGGIVVEDDLISELIPAGGQPSRETDEVVDASDCVMIPGLINCHHHFYQTLTRAFPAALDKELFEWLTSLYPVWANLTGEAISVATELALTELLLSGCTTAADHHYLFNGNTGDAIDRQAETAGNMGIRVLLTRGSMSLGRDQGGLPPDEVVQTEEEILEDSERLLSTWHDTRPGAMIQIALAPCSPFSVSTALMRDSASLARRYQARLHTHLAETEDENRFCLERFGLRPLDYLESVGWLADDVWLAHGIHFTESEILRLGKARTAICHCPGSNMILSSGLCPVRDLLAAGCPVGLGVDGSASNDSSNLMQEARQAFLLQRLRYGAANVTHEDVLRLATTGGAALMGRSDIGEIQTGKQADIALFDLDELRFSGAGDPVAALVLCGAHHARHVMVAGKWRVRNGTLSFGDPESLMQRHRTQAAMLAR